MVSRDIGKFRRPSDTYQAVHRILRYLRAAEPSCTEAASITAEITIDAIQERSFMSSNSNHRIFAIVLAAGAASRFGRLKQIEPVAETCLLGIVVKNALMCEGIERVILVLGAQSDTVKSALGEIAEHEKLTIVVNGEYREGLSTSLHAGLKEAQTYNCDAVTFLLGDMPLIDTRLLGTVIARYRSSSCKLCYVKTDGRAGHPIIARKDLFDEFLKVRGDIGGRKVVRENMEMALGVEVGDSDGDHQLDINYDKDMETYRSRYRE